MEMQRNKLAYLILCTLFVSGCSIELNDTKQQPSETKENNRSIQITDASQASIPSLSAAVAAVEPMQKTGEFANAMSRPHSTTVKFSLSTALKLAQEYSLRTVITHAHVEEAEQRIDEAKAGYYPKVQAITKTADFISGRSSHVPRSFDEYAQMQLTLQYNLLDFGRTSHAVGSAHEILKSATFTDEKEVNSVLFDTTKAYLDVRRYTLLLAAAEDYVKTTSELVETLSVRVAGGGSPKSELVRGQLALISAQNRQKTIDLQLLKAKQKLRSLVGQDISVQMNRLDDISSRMDLNAIVAHIQLENPEIKARLAELNGAKEDLSAAKAARYPSVDVVGAYKKPFQNPDGLDANYLGSNVALQISVPVLDGGIISSRIGQALARLRAVEATYGQLQRDISEMAYNLSNDASNAKDMWKIQGRAQDDASRTKDLYLDEFRLGTRSLNDLISVQTDFFNASVGRVSSQYDYYLSSLGLYLLSGQVDNGIKMLKLR